MIIIWKGKGGWALYLWAMVMAVPLFIDFLFDKQLGIPVVRYLSEVVGIGRCFGILMLIFPGIPMMVLGTRRQQLSGIQRVISEPDAGRFLPRRPAHTLYHINVFYWGVLGSVLGLILIVM